MENQNQPAPNSGEENNAQNMEAVEKESAFTTGFSETFQAFIEWVKTQSMTTQIIYAACFLLTIIASIGHMSYYGTYISYYSPSLFHVKMIFDTDPILFAFSFIVPLSLSISIVCFFYWIASLINFFILNFQKCRKFVRLALISYIGTFIFCIPLIVLHYKFNLGVSLAKLSLAVAQYRGDITSYKYVWIYNSPHIGWMCFLLFTVLFDTAVYIYLTPKDEKLIKKK